MISKDVKDAWIAALRSGRYEQAEGAMARETPDGQRCYCALGVLADIIDPCGWSPDEEMHGSYLTHTLARNDYAYLNEDVLPIEVQQQLADLNDCELACLASIASWIDANVAAEVAP